MDRRWIDDLLRLNMRIVAAEDRLATQVADLFAMNVQGQDTIDTKQRFIFDHRNLRLLRLLRDDMLDEIVDGD